MNTKKIGLIAGVGSFLFFLSFDIFSPAVDKMLAVALWMVIWWVTEVVSISVTALIPLIFFPLLDITDLGTVAYNYASPVVFLFLGGFLMAIALEKVNLHKRIALLILRMTGTTANGIILGFMTATAVMSMWISNTASAVVMLPIATSVVDLLMSIKNDYTYTQRKNFSLAIMLSIAFGANIGGVGTLIGSPPNSIMLAYIQSEYSLSIGFFQWMKLGIPFVIIMLALTYFLLVRVMYPNRMKQLAHAHQVLAEERALLGKMSRREYTVLSVFLLAIVMWILRGQINEWLPSLSLSDTTISMFAAFCMFIIPVDVKKFSFSIDWKDTSRLPWGILILFGGGLSLASGFKAVGLVSSIGAFIADHSTWNIFVIIVILLFVMVFLTEFMSNVALVSVLVPLVAGATIELDVPMLQIIVPITMASSCAFMLPMATPPNAIVFASGHVKVFQMIRIGFMLNVLAIALLLLCAYFFVPYIF